MREVLVLFGGMLLADGGSVSSELGSALGGVTAIESSSVDPMIGTLTCHWPQLTADNLCFGQSTPKCGSVLGL